MAFNALQLKLLAGILATLGTLAGSIAYEQHQQTLALRDLLNQQRITAGRQAVTEQAFHVQDRIDSEQIKAAIEQSKRVDELFSAPKSSAPLP